MKKRYILFSVIIMFFISGCAEREDAGIKTNQFSNDYMEYQSPYSMLEPQKYEYRKGDYQNDFSNSILNKDMYTGMHEGTDAVGIYYPEIELRTELEEYFVEGEEGNYDALVGMFYDYRTLELKEEELLDLFVKHGYFLFFHQGKIGDLHLRIIEIQERDGLSTFPCRIVMQSWDEKYLYMQDITSNIPRKVRNLFTIDNRDEPRIILHTSGFTSDYIPEEEVLFLAFRRTGRVLCPLEVGIYPPENYSVVFYSDGIAFPSRTRNVGSRYAYYRTHRFGIMEEIEKNKQFRMYGITEEDRATVVSSCYIELTLSGGE